jgi:hypothetical protein
MHAVDHGTTSWPPFVSRRGANQRVGMNEGLQSSKTGMALVRYRAANLPSRC